MESSGYFLRIFGRHAHHRRINRVMTALFDDFHLTTWKIIGVLFWTSICALGTVLTIKNCKDLIDQYLQEPKATTLSLQTNVSMTFPIPLTMCLSMKRLYATELWLTQIYDAKRYDDLDRVLFLNGRDREFFVGKHVPGKNQWPVRILRQLDYFVRAKVEEDSLEKVVKWLGKTLNVTKAEFETSLKLQLGQVKANASATEYQDAIATFFNRPNITRESVLAENWPPSWIFITLTCLNIAKELELYVNQDNYAFGGTRYSGVSYKRLIHRPEHTIDRIKACVELENNLRLLNVTTDELRQEFGRKVWDMFQIEMDFLTSVTRTTVVSAVEVCYKLSTEPFEKSSGSKWLSFDSEVLQYPQKSQDGDEEEEEEEPAGRLALDFSGRERNVFIDPAKVCPNCEDMEDAELLALAVRHSDKAKFMEFEIGVGTMETVLIDISALFRYLPVVKGKTQCNGDQRTIYECFRDCKADVIKKYLNCTPTSLVPLRENERECSIKTLSEWKFNGIEFERNNFNGSEEHRCNGKCLNSCEDWHMKFEKQPPGGINHQDTIDSTTFATPTQIILQVGFGSFEYTIYEEMFAQTWESFLGGIGGILGLYLGIDMIMAAQMLVAPIVLSRNVHTRLKSRPENGITRLQLEEIVSKNNLLLSQQNFLSIMEEIKEMKEDKMRDREHIEQLQLEVRELRGRLERQQQAVIQ